MKWLSNPAVEAIRIELIERLQQLRSLNKRWERNGSSNGHCLLIPKLPLGNAAGSFWLPETWQVSATMTPKQLGKKLKQLEDDMYRYAKIWNLSRQQESGMK